MHGTLRFLLASVVTLSHLGYGQRFGASAVVVFYMLAGYVVTQLLEKHFSGRLLAFYAERFLRIYPLYVVFLLATSVFLLATGFGQPSFTPFNVFANLSIIPLNYYMFWDTTVVREMCILPPAWSLGVEIQAYLVLPLILRAKAAKWTAGLLSLAVFTAATAGVINSEHWGYRLLPGILFIFLAGSALAKTIKTPGRTDTFDRFFPSICWTWLLLLLVGGVAMHSLTKVILVVLLGFLTGLPAIILSSRSKIRFAGDKMLGQLSYGLFLIHYPLMWLYEHLGGTPRSAFGVLFVFMAAVTVSWLATTSLERRVWVLRKAVTGS